MLLCNCIMPPATLSLSEVLVPAAPPRASRGRCFSQLSSEKSAVAPPPQRRWRVISPLETRISLILALASQASSLSQRAFLGLATETAKYVFPRRFPSRNLEEAFMSVPDLETVKFKVLSQTDQYEIRDVDPYYIASTMMPGNKGFDDFNGASRSFNVLAAYLFGKNATPDKIEMTTPVITQKTQSGGEKMEMTTPVITKRLEDQTKWQMSFVMPSKYGANLPFPKDPSVKIREVGCLRNSNDLEDAPRLEQAGLQEFQSGFVTDEDIKRRESKLRDALKYDRQFQAKVGASLEVAQYNPPFTLPFMRRNEIALEVERKPE